MAGLIEPERVRTHFSLRHFEMPGEKGTRVIVFPTCDVPLSHLVRKNWNPPEAWGKTRKVERVDALVDGTQTSLFVKRPEHFFSAEPIKLGSGMPWLAYGDSHVRVDGRAVEQMAVSEAKILLGLLHSNIPAELPLALFVNANGTRELVTKGVAKSRKGAYTGGLGSRAVACFEDLLRPLAVHAGDLDVHNLVEDSDGRAHIIDVNRWQWPGVTDRYYRALLKAIRAELEKRWERGTG